MSREREHREETRTGRAFWRCIPVTDAVQREAEAHAAGRAEGCDEYKEATDAAMNYGQGYAAGRAEALGELDTLPWAEILHDLDGTQHYITHKTSYEGDDMEGVACITGPEGHAEDATDLLRAVLAALTTTETNGDGDA